MVKGCPANLGHARRDNVHRELLTALREDYREEWTPVLMDALAACAPHCDNKEVIECYEKMVWVMDQLMVFVTPAEFTRAMQEFARVSLLRV